MRKVLFLLILVLILTSASISPINAAQMFYGGRFGRQGLWPRLLNTNTSIFWSQGDFYHIPWEGEDIHQLADHGIKINYRFGLWEKFYNGELAWNTSVVDLYYNASLMELMEGEIDWQFSYLDPDKIWAVTLSEEEPMYAYYHFWSQEAFEKYNNSYHTETGFWLRWKSGSAFFETVSEQIILDDWLSEKFVWVFNHLHDYIKSKWPHLLVFQFVHAPWPGATPVWVGGIDVSDLKADAYMSDLYYYEVYDNPFWLYEFVRQAKSTYDKEYHLHLWGQESWPGSAGGFEHIRRNAWLAYLAGVDVIGWFVWHYMYGHLWEREDTLGNRFFIYINRLNSELSKLPRFRPRPQVLVIRDQMMSFQVGLCCDLGLFNEWDVVNQRTLIKKDMDLSQYKLIVVNEDRYHDEVVEKLNEYVRSGGNLIMLGGFGWEQKNFYDNATRASKFLIEEGIRQEHVWGDIFINFSKPNPLDLNLQYEYVDSSMLAISKNTLSENHHAIGEFTFFDERGTPIQMEHCPLVLYHNSSNPEEGSILYWGVVSGPVPPLGIPDVQYQDVVEAFIQELSYTRFLYRNVTRAFARNYLHLNGSVATSGTEEMIITQSEIEEGVILAGISNFYPQAMSLNYTLDLSNFGLPDGEYWVHSVDGNLTLGWFESQQSVLEVPLNIVANGTRLLLISQQQLEPSYSVKVFPEIPTPDEVEDLWAKDIPSASFTYFPTEPSPRDSISFVDTSTDPNGEIVYWFWDFGDRETYWSLEQNPTHQFTQEGEYNVTVTIVDNDGCTNTANRIIIVEYLPPIVNYTYSPSIITAGQEVSFSDDSTHPQGRTITSWSWHFGDESTSTERNPTHKFENPGSFTVTLTIRDDEEMEGTYSEIIDVEPKQIEPEQIESDYTIYFMVGGLSIIAVFVIMIITRRRQ